MKKIIGNVGDVNYPEYDGGPVILNDDGSYCLEYVEPPCDDVDRDDPEARWTVYRTDLDEPGAWCKWSDVAECCGQDVEQYTACFAASFGDDDVSKDENAMARAQAIVDAAGYYGWVNFDSYPLILTKDEVEARYAEEPSCSECD